MTFNCRGYIRKWTVGLHEQTGVHDSYPEIQTSRLCDGTSNVYARQQTTHFRNASCENGIASVSTNVYIVVPFPPLVWLLSLEISLEYINLDDEMVCM